MVLSKDEFINRINSFENVSDELKSQFMADVTDTFEDYEKRYNVEEVNNLQEKYNKVVTDYKNRFLSDNNANVDTDIREMQKSFQEEKLVRDVINVTNF